MTTVLFPDPLVPAEVDLQGYDFMPLYGERLFKSVTWISASAEEKVAALRLWWHAFANERPAGTLPDDERLLAEYAGYGVAVEAWRKVRPNAMRNWKKCSDGRLHHPFLATVVLESWLERLLQLRSSRAGNASRWGGDGSTVDVDAMVFKSAGILEGLDPNSRVLKKVARIYRTGKQEQAKNDPTGSDDADQKNPTGTKEPGTKNPSGTKKAAPDDPGGSKKGPKNIASDRTGQDRVGQEHPVQELDLLNSESGLDAARANAQAPPAKPKSPEKPKNGHHAPPHGPLKRGPDGLIAPDFGMLTEKNLEAAKAAAPGWDPYALEATWIEWCKGQGLRVAHPGKHFLAFCTTHAANNRGSA